MNPTCHGSIRTAQPYQGRGGNARALNLESLVAKSRNVRLLSVAMQLKQQVGELIKQCLQAKIDRAKKTYQHMLEEMKGVPEPTTASGNQLGLHELGH